MATKTLAVPAVPQSSPFPQLTIDRKIDSLTELVDRVLDQPPARKNPAPGVIFVVTESDGTVTIENSEGRDIDSASCVYVARLRYAGSQIVERKRECLEEMLEKIS